MPATIRGSTRRSDGSAAIADLGDGSRSRRAHRLARETPASVAVWQHSATVSRVSELRLRAAARRRRSTTGCGIVDGLHGRNNVEITSVARYTVAIIRARVFQQSVPFLTMRRRLAAATLTLLFLPIAAVPDDDADDAQSLEIFGWVERVELLDGQLSVKAKLDTGAATSSLDTSSIERFERDGKRWVRFVVVDPENDESIELEKRIMRNVRIVQHDGEHQRLPVVMLDVCFGPVRKEVEFSLINRSNFIYPVLLGRSALENVALIDPSETFLNYPDCEDAGSDDNESDAE